MLKCSPYLLASSLIVMTIWGTWVKKTEWLAVPFRPKLVKVLAKISFSQTCGWVERNNNLDILREHECMFENWIDYVHWYTVRDFQNWCT